MFKKTVLVLVFLLIFLVPGVLAANSLTVDLEVRDFPPVAPNTLFNVDIYVTSDFYANIGSTTIKLIPVETGTTAETGAARFTGLGTPGDLFASVTPSYILNGGAGYYAVTVATVSSITPGKRYKLGTLGMQVFSPNSFNIKLDKTNSFAKREIPVLGDDPSTTTVETSYKKLGDYTLSINPTKIVKTFCVPKTAVACSSLTLDCGKSTLDDGCGGLVECTSSTPACSSGKVCDINNVCVSAVDLVLPVTAQAYDKTVLQQVSDTVANAGLSKLQKLSAIVNAVKTWLAAQ